MRCRQPKGPKKETERGIFESLSGLNDLGIVEGQGKVKDLGGYIDIHESTITKQLKRGGEDVAQMRAETLLAVEARPSGEVVLTKGQPCDAGVATEVGTFSGIRTCWRLTVVFTLFLRASVSPHTSLKKHSEHPPLRLCLGKVFPPSRSEFGQLLSSRHGCLLVCFLNPVAGCFLALRSDASLSGGSYLPQPTRTYHSVLYDTSPNQAYHLHSLPRIANQYNREIQSCSQACLVVEKDLTAPHQSPGHFGGRVPGSLVYLEVNLARHTLAARVVHR